MPCAPSTSRSSTTRSHLGCTAGVLTVDPHTLDDVLASLVTIGHAVGREAEAQVLVASLRERLDAVSTRVAGRPRPRVVVLEWTDPPYAPGHWIPDMVVAAGGEPVLGTAGEEVGERFLGCRPRRPTRRHRLRPVRLRPRGSPGAGRRAHGIRPAARGCACARRRRERRLEAARATAPRRRRGARGPAAPVTSGWLARSAAGSPGSRAHQHGCRSRWVPGVSPRAMATRRRHEDLPPHRRTARRGHQPAVTCDVLGRWRGTGRAAPAPVLVLPRPTGTGWSPPRWSTRAPTWASDRHPGAVSPVRWRAAASPAATRAARSRTAATLG